jgi:hypothetical protein
MSTEQTTEETPTPAPQELKPLTKSERAQALIEVHSFLNDIQRPTSNTLRRVYEDSLAVLAQVTNSILAELREEQEAQKTIKTRTKAKTTKK